MSLDPAAWRAAALDPPRAHGAPLSRGRLKLAPEDFIVEERLGFVADGGSGHVLLKVRKRGRDTLSLARELARAGGVAPRDVGFAGLKDRHAVTTQWFTVPARRAAADWAGQAGPDYAVEEALPHSRKLKRGALRGNRFRITLREVEVDAAALAARVELLTGVGVPNYFGPQRFGRDGSNLDSIARFVASGELPNGREPRAFVYSAARALVFNALLARRVGAGSWNRLLDGEFVNLEGRNSWFAAEHIDATLEERLARHDVNPTGPLAGRGEAPGAVAGALESAVVAEFGELQARLVTSGLEAARRPLRLRPDALQLSRSGSDLTVEFGLPAGAYATVVLRELVSTEPLPGEANDD